MTVVIHLPQDRAWQINFALALYPFMGLHRPQVCNVCGGIKDDEQAKTRRCMCILKAKEGSE